MCCVLFCVVFVWIDVWCFVFVMVCCMLVGLVCFVSFYVGVLLRSAMLCFSML